MFQTEFGGMSGQLQMANETQKSLKQQVEYLQYERDILLEELERQGSISEQVRWVKGQTREAELHLRTSQVGQRSN